LRPLLEEQYLKDNKKAFLRVFQKCGKNLDNALNVILETMNNEKAAPTARMAAARTIISLTEQGQSTMKGDLEERLEGKKAKAKSKEKELLKDNPELEDEDNVIGIDEYAMPQIVVGDK
jgi:hypothetical protein